MPDEENTQFESECQKSKHNLQYGDETYAILGACFAVYKDKGCGFLEAVYQECLEIEMEARGIPFVAQQELRLTYRGRLLRHVYVADLVCFGKILVELKAVRAIDPNHRAQTMHYLRGTAIDVGLLVNFGHYPQCEYERIIATTGRYTAQYTADLTPTVEDTSLGEP